ncbi:MAG: hypothetical protein ABID54_13170 [Pseudomonadota bacterium]
MKTAIVSSKNLTPECWSAKRFVGGCEDCQRVMRCKLPEGVRGQVKKLEIKIEENETKTTELRRKLDAIINKL